MYDRNVCRFVLYTQAAYHEGELTKLCGGSIATEPYAVSFRKHSVNVQGIFGVVGRSSINAGGWETFAIWSVKRVVHETRGGPHTLSDKATKRW
jgi:hypothetical protein